jgi:CBS domain-containing protein
VLIAAAPLSDGEESLPLAGCGGIGESERATCGFSVHRLRVRADGRGRRATHAANVNVESVMSRDVVTVTLSTPLKEVARLLVGRGVSGVPVVDETGAVVGVVSEQDVVSKERGVAAPAHHTYEWLFGPEERDPHKRTARTAGDAMTAPPILVEPGMSVARAARLMVERAVNRLPVVSKGELVGIATRADLVRAFTRSDEELEREIREDVMLRTLWISPRRLRVLVADGEVVLDGEVDTRTEAELLAAYVARVPGVVSVDDSRLHWRSDDLARRRWQNVPRRP